MMRCWPCRFLALPLLAAAGRDFDVIVYGATPSGVQAAVAAAREHAEGLVALVEPGLYLGGMMSGGLGKTDTGVHPETIGGQAREFFERVADRYGVPRPIELDWCIGKNPPSVFEPHVAEDIFLDMLREANVSLLLGKRFASVELDAAKRIAAAFSVEGQTFRARQWVDATYEGTLMKLAGVTYTWGRESTSEYNEGVAGVLPEPTPKGPPYGKTEQFEIAVNPFADESNSTCLPHVTCNDGGEVGQGDLKVGAYDWRVVLTRDPNNMVPIPDPSHYDPAEFELLRRMLPHYSGMGPPGSAIPNGKSDWKIGGVPGFSGEYVGGNWEYPNATWERQQEIVAEHKRFALALLKFWRSDPAVPAESRAKWADGKVGLPRDEFNRSGHWSPQLYVREALRLRGEYVMTQHDVENTTTKADVIGLCSYTVDIPGAVQRIVKDGRALLEGGLQVPTWCNRSQPVYAVPLRSVLPKRNDCTNLQVPVALSATHVAFSSIRMEPQWMIIGQSVGVAAAMALRAGTDLHDLNVASLQRRLRELGQNLGPLTGSDWYAWKQMWKIVDGKRLVAVKDASILKREYTSSKELPAAEVRRFEANATVLLNQPPTQAADSEYWLVSVSSLPAGAIVV